LSRFAILGVELRAVDIIRKKRDGARLSREEIQYFISGSVAGEIPDYQATALLMAVFLKGMDSLETSHLTLAMRDSGDVVEFQLPSIPVDKHSTGGVGDKTSISLAPLAAACGAFVPMVSGRGLGHTGGTLDKLESIPGFTVGLPLDEFKRITQEIGTCLIGQTKNMCPADRKFYSLRDVTGTVECIPLIVSSILSKKSAEGIGALVMDVKSGSGAFMKNDDEATELAMALRDTGRQFGLKISAIVTGMDEPLGQAVGNALEVAEAIDFLKGTGPADYRRLTYALASEMLVLSGVCKDHVQAQSLAENKVEDGSALEKLKEIIKAHGGQPDVVDDYSIMGRAKDTHSYRAARSGFLNRMDTYRIGVAAMKLGAGRERAEDDIDHAVGFLFKKSLGDAMESGEEIVEIHFNDSGKLANALSELDQAFTIESDKEPQGDLIRKVISSD
jgi:pyrimidine-nucleoside phosphorylase